MAEAKKKFGEADFKALVSREISLADSSRAGRSKKQTNALEYYQGVMNDVPAETGRSKAVSRDLADTMGWVLPGIMRVYTASEHMAVAEPIGPEDVDGAAQATDGINYVFWKENDGYRVVYNATWDSLLSGDGIVKVWRDTTPKVEISTHSGLDDDELTALLSDEQSDIEVLEYSGPYGETETPDGLHAVKIKRTTKYGCTKVEALPPEDYGKSDEAKTCDEARFQYHRERKTRSELIEMGFDREKVEAVNRSADNDTSEEIAREDRGESDDGDQSMELVDLYECYVRVDTDYDGVAELYRVFYAGSRDGGEILDKEEWDDELPFESIPCQPMPHRFESGSLADETMDVQRIKTALLRQALDNTYATNNPQRFVTGKITNPEELFSPSFGGAIFGETNATVMPLTVPFVANHAYDAINYQDQVIERRTGVSRTTMALDPDALQNQTATANQNAKDAAYSQIELIARNQAELGWKKVFRKILKLEIKHQNKARTIRMRGRFVEVDPRHWNADMDVSINVGLGTGSRDRDMAVLQQILANQTGLATQMGALSPAKALEMLPYIMTTLTKQAEAAGIRSPELFYPEVTSDDVKQGQEALAQQAQQPNPEIELEKSKAQIQMQIEQAKAEASVAKEKAQMEADLVVKQSELEKNQAIEAQKLQADAIKTDREFAFKEKELAQKRDLELMKMGMAQKDDGSVVSKDDERHESTVSSMAQLAGVMERLMAAQNAPKRIVRDPQTGRAIGVEPVVN
jgi:hypothetical protein